MKRYTTWRIYLKDIKLLYLEFVTKLFFFLLHLLEVWKLSIYAFIWNATLHDAIKGIKIKINNIRVFNIRVFTSTGHPANLNWPKSIRTIWVGHLCIWIKTESNRSKSFMYGLSHEFRFINQLTRSWTRT